MSFPMDAAIMSPAFIARGHPVEDTAAQGRLITSIWLAAVLTYGFIGSGWAIIFFSGASLNRYVRIVALCLSWASMSVGMHVLNKALVSALNTPAMIALVQMAITFVATAVMAAGELIKADRKQLLMWLIVPFFFAAMLCSSTYTYSYISLSLLTIIRNLAPLVSLSVETLVMPAHKQPTVSNTAVFAILLMLTGALVYGQDSSGISFLGIFLAVLNMAIAISDRVLQRRLLTEECKGLTSGVCTVVTNFFGMVPTALLVLGTHELSNTSTGANVWAEQSVLSLLILSGFVGMGIGYLGFECQREISATSFFVLQNASKVAVVAAGIAFFSDPVSTATIGGLTLSLMGSFIYGRAQMAPREAEKQQESEPLIDKEASAKA